MLSHTVHRPILALFVCLLTLVFLHPATQVEASSAGDNIPCPAPGYHCDPTFDNAITKADPEAIINYLNRKRSDPNLPYELHLDINRDGNITALDALLIINFLNAPRAWRNPINSCDVSNDGYISPIDALLVINYLNGGDFPVAYLDVDGDGLVSASDSEQVISYLDGDTQSCPAPPTGIIRYVATTGDDVGNDCADSALPCRTIQHAIDSANSDDQIRVAEGEYNDMNERNGEFQMAYIDKTITLRGGYTTDDWLHPNPALTPTVLDAMYSGRGLYLTGGSSAIVADLTIRNGYADIGGGILVTNTPALLANLTVEGNEAEYSGGGIYLNGSTPALHNSIVRNNVVYGYYGGGVNLNQANALVENNLIENNTNADGWGGGLYAVRSHEAIVQANVVRANSAEKGAGIYLYQSDTLLDDNIIDKNIASQDGGGLYVNTNSNPTVINSRFANNEASNGGGAAFFYSTATVNNNLFYDNTASSGGGLMLAYGADTLADNTITYNSADVGGGISLVGGTPTINTSVVSHNEGVLYGGGILLAQATNATFTNTVVNNNSITSSEDWASSGIYLSAATGKFVHMTIANNTGGQSAVAFRPGSSAEFTNSIFANQTLAIKVDDSAQASVDGVLWHNNATNYSGNVIVNNEVTGDPLFAEDGYHLTAGSAARDLATTQLVSADIDNQQRDSQPDYGADELQAAAAAGDCTGDDAINAADITGTISEIFDGDGDNVADVSGGLFAGSAGCDSTADTFVNAGDLTCTIAIIFDGPNACQS